MSTFAGRYDKPLLKLVGNRLIPAKSATVEVFESDGSTQASLFTSRTKGTAADNPTAPDEVGNLEFFADPGTYVLSIIEDSSVVATNDVAVQPDPLEPADTPTSSEIVGEFTGTPDGTQFLRDDGTLASAGGATNLSWDAATSTVESDPGTDATLTPVDATNPGLMSVVDKSKIDGVETGATADQTGAEIKTAYEAELDTNAYTDAEKTKLTGIEANATADQTAAEIRVLGFFDITNDGTGSGLDADLLDGNQATAFATAAQGALADTALQNATDVVGEFTGIPDGTQFLRDDGTLASAGGGGVPIDATGLVAGDDIITGDNATIEESADGTFRIVSTLATATPLIVMGAASQSAPYIELLDSAGAVHGSLSKPGTGKLRLSGSTSASFPYIDLGPAADARKTIITCASGGHTELHYHDNGVYVDISAGGVDIVPVTGGVSITPAAAQNLAFFGATGATQAANAGTASGTDALVINAIITALVNYGLMAA